MEPPVIPKPMPTSVAELLLDHTNKLSGIVYINLTGLIDTIVSVAVLWSWEGMSMSYLIKLEPIFWSAVPTQSANCQFPNASKPADQGWFLDKEKVNYQIYPDTVDQLLWDHMFVHITETLEEKDNLKAIDWDFSQYKVIHFKDHQDTATSQNCEGVVQHPEIFEKTLPDLPTEKHIQHSIQLKAAVPKARLIYQLTPNKDDTLCAYLKGTLEKGLIQPS
ncbi:hypothetical protein DSO57_1024905 [Entomophthora muscae]|uniref:Uncharacterized protein n=1 Tax=Entomophthora muscae TaxID=34485 RepID=A0ACC2T2D2_9FUNG|nr:hypothetical protein DSO57_1024905 [Entomophthora muscae]